MPSPISEVYLSLGSNLGNSVSLIEQALAAIAALPHVELTATSALYKTSPVSPIPQNDFINAACKLQSTLGPNELLIELQDIERALGKVLKPKTAPRPIDIDICLFGSHFCNTERLTLPHPHWRRRLFVLIPLLDIADTITFPTDAEGHFDTIDLRECVAQLLSVGEDLVRKV